MRTHFRTPFGRLAWPPLIPFALLLGLALFWPAPTPQVGAELWFLAVLVGLLIGATIE